MHTNFSIIEDCNPYYVRFSHDNIDKLIQIANEAISRVNFTQPFTNYNFDPGTANKLKLLCPLFDHYNLSKTRFGAFVSQPGFYHRVHKDGSNHRFSINYPLQVLDNKCVTSWYSDENLSIYEKTTLKIPNGHYNIVSRDCIGFDKSKHIPEKTMVAQSGECILFNTDIYHDWDNTQSSHQRVVLTLRLMDYNVPGSFFSDARETLLKLAS